MPKNAALPPRPPVTTTAFANGAGPVRLTLEPLTVAIPLDARLRDAAFDVVLEGVELSELGKGGGFDYSLYANLPENRVPLEEAGSFEIGEFGSFSISMPAMHGMNATPGTGKTVRFPASDALVRQAKAGVPQERSLMLSFVAYGEPSGVARHAELVRIERISVVPS